MPKAKKKNYKCTLCDRTFATPQGLAGHGNAHKTKQKSVKKESKSQKEVNNKRSKKGNKQRKATSKKTKSLQFSNERSDESQTNLFKQETTDNTPASDIMNDDSTNVTTTHQRNVVPVSCHYSQTLLSLDDIICEKSEKDNSEVRIYEAIELNVKQNSTDKSQSEQPDVQMKDTQVNDTKQENERTENMSEDDEEVSVVDALIQDDENELDPTSLNDDNEKTTRDASEIETDEVFVNLVSSDINKKQKFQVFCSQLFKTARLKLLEKENKKWIAQFGQSLYRNRVLSTPTVISNNNTNTSMGNDSKERSLIIDSMIDSEMAYNIYTTSEKEMSDLMVLDPIFVIKRYPQFCWGIDFQSLFKYVKHTSVYTKYVSRFQKDKLISILQLAFPHFITSEMKHLKVIAFTQWQRKKTRTKTSKVKPKKQKSKGTSEDQKDTNNLGSTPTDEPEKKSPQDVPDGETDTIKTTDVNPNSSENIDTLLNRLSKKDVKEFEEFLKEKENSFWLDVLLPRVSTLTVKDKKKKTSDQCNRILPIVLLPFFLRTLHYNVRSNNCIPILCDSLSKDLAEYRNELLTSHFGTSANSDRFSVLDLTIKQLRMNTIKDGYLYHIMSHKTEMIATVAYDNVVERLQLHERTINTQKKEIKQLKKTLKKLEDKVDSNMKCQDDDNVEEDKKHKKVKRKKASKKKVIHKATDRDEEEEKSNESDASE